MLNISSTYYESLVVSSIPHVSTGEPEQHLEVQGYVAGNAGTLFQDDSS